MAQLKTPAIMLQGTGSDVGKSLLLAGLCRIFARRGLKVRPFKPQNMSNNAAVTVDGGEVGRAQALQARACGVPLTTDMNPVLLKPQSEVGSQVIVQGRIHGTFQARDYGREKPNLMPFVAESFERLAAEADLVLVEGAGSPAEVNLRAGDIANMGFAEAMSVPVILVGDIDRGGVIASLVGTAALLPPSERERIKGFIINKFRGDLTLFDEGVRIIQEKSGFEPLGTVPHFDAARRLPAEDAVAMDHQRPVSPDAPIRIAVPALARIANFDDFDPLMAEADVQLDFIKAGQALPGDADLVILPGSKATMADLRFFYAQGWDIDLKAHLRRGGMVLGICGGYQMLGTTIVDPDGIEGPPGEMRGLGLLDLDTVLGGEKKLVEVTGKDNLGNHPIQGYEMHVGITTGGDRQRPFLQIDDKEEGAISADGKIQGCYLHGLFQSDTFRHFYLSLLKDREESGLVFDAQVEAVLDLWADHLAHHLSIERIEALARAR
ncbi:MAG: cobyric acid synthase [Pseudomonadota bacterium]